MARAAGPHWAVALTFQLALEMTAFAEPMKARLDTQHEIRSRLAVASDARVGAGGAVYSIVMTRYAIRVAVEGVREKQRQARVSL